MSRLHGIGFVLALLMAAPARRAQAPTPEAEREAIENAAWNAFCDRLKETGREILREELPATDLDRAEGQRYLLQRLAASIDEVLDARIGPPVVELYSHKLGKYGMDSADAKYSTARLAATAATASPARLGTAHHIAFQLVTNRDGYEAFDSISREDIPVDGSGNFELLISASRAEGLGRRLAPAPSPRVGDPAARVLLRLGERRPLGVPDRAPRPHRPFDPDHTGRDRRALRRDR